MASLAEDADNQILSTASNSMALSGQNLKAVGVIPDELSTKHSVASKNRT